MNILALVHNKATACEVYRVFQPVRGLAEIGHHAVSLDGDAASKYTERRVDILKGADIVLFNRIAGNTKEVAGILELVHVCRKRGIATVCDYDDDLTNEVRKTQDGPLPDLSVFDAITVTTEYLAGIYKSRGARRIYILPNLVDAQTFRTAPRAYQGRTIGLSGSITHKRDWEPAAQAILDVIPNHPGWDIFCSGMVPECMKGHARVIIPRDILGARDTVNDGVAVRYPRYPEVMKNVDILLCPVEPRDRFNQCKSNLKAIEGMASWRPLPGGEGGGALVLATGRPLGIYLNAVIPGKTGILVTHTREAWREALEIAIDSWPSPMQAAGHEYAINNFSASRQRSGERATVYQEIVDKLRDHRVNTVASRIAPLTPR